MTNANTNPLIGLEGLPPFSKIKPEHVVPALKHGIEQCRQAIEDVLAKKSYTWNDLVLPLEEADDNIITRCFRRYRI